MPSLLTVRMGSHATPARPTTATATASATSAVANPRPNAGNAAATGAAYLAGPTTSVTRPATVDPLTYTSLVSATIPTHLGTISDTTYGTTIRRITNVNGKRHNYASIPAWNSDGTLLNLGLDVRAMLNGSTYAELQGTQSNQGTLFWSHVTPSKAWCQNGTNNGYRRLTVNTATGVISVAATFAASSISRPGGGTYTEVAVGGVDGGIQGVQSDDDQYVAFMWRASSDWGIGVIDLSTDTVHAERTMGTGATSISALMDNCGMSHTGDWAWFTFVADGTGTTQGMWLYEADLNTSTRRQANTSQEHCDWVKTDSGDRFVYWNGNVTSMDPVTGTKTVVLTPVQGGTHISGRAYRYPNWVLVSQHQGYSYTDPGANVVYALDVLNPGDAKVFCFHHKTQASASAYGGEIHASPYWDLTKVVFAVNWESDGTNVYAFVAGVNA